MVPVTSADPFDLQRFFRPRADQASKDSPPSTARVAPEPSEAMWAERATIHHLHAHAGNQQLLEALSGGGDAYGAVLHDAAMVGLSGVHAAPLVPGSAPPSAMRAVMRKRGQAEDEGLDTARASQLLGKRSGQPLPEAVRARMERAFGQDFRHVRIHTDGAAVEAAGALNAHAFTNGRDIYFGQGAWRPGSIEGIELLAHELTHVVQAMEGRLPQATGGGLEVSSPGDAHEREAEAKGHEIARQIAGMPAGEAASAGLVRASSGAETTVLDSLDVSTLGASFLDDAHGPEARPSKGGGHTEPREVAEVSTPVSTLEAGGLVLRDKLCIGGADMFDPEGGACKQSLVPPSPKSSTKTSGADDKSKLAKGPRVSGAHSGVIFKGSFSLEGPPLLGFIRLTGGAGISLELAKGTSETGTASTGSAKQARTTAEAHVKLGVKLDLLLFTLSFDLTLTGKISVLSKPITTPEQARSLFRDAIGDLARWYAAWKNGQQGDEHLKKIAKLMALHRKAVMKPFLDFEAHIKGIQAGKIPRWSIVRPCAEKHVNALKILILVMKDPADKLGISKSDLEKALDCPTGNIEDWEMFKTMEKAENSAILYAKMGTPKYYQKNGYGNVSPKQMEEDGKKLRDMAKPDVNKMVKHRKELGKKFDGVSERIAKLCGYNDPNVGFEGSIVVSATAEFKAGKTSGKVTAGYGKGIKDSLGAKGRFNTSIHDTWVIAGEFSWPNGIKINVSGKPGKLTFVFEKPSELASNTSRPKLTPKQANRLSADRARWTKMIRRDSKKFGMLSGNPSKEQITAFVEKLRSPVTNSFSGGTATVGQITLEGKDGAVSRITIRLSALTKYKAEWARGAAGLAKGKAEAATGSFVEFTIDL